MFQQAICK